MVKYFHLERIIGFTVGLVFLTNNVIFGYTPERSFWEERRSKLSPSKNRLAACFNDETRGVGPLSISPAIQSVIPKEFLAQHDSLFRALSSPYAVVRQASLPGRTKAPLIIHIQDVHRHAEAQKNIGLAIQELIHTGKIDGVALEGSAGEFPLSPYQQFHHPRAVRAVADYLFKNQKISGPVYTALISSTTIPSYVGVEDPAHYSAHVDAYRKSVPLQALVKGEISQEAIRLGAKKAKFYSSRLLSFDQVAEGYHRGERSLGEFIRHMSHESPDLPPHARVFLEALEREENINLQSVDRERTLLIEKLTRALRQEDLDSLIAHSMAYRSQRESYGQFYGYLKNLCRSAGVDLSEFPAMKRYVEYILVSEKIQAEKLFKELTVLETWVYAQLARTDEARDLVRQCKQNRLAAKLADFSLTPEEWSDYQQTKPNEISANLPLGTFEAFYKEAHIRDQKMAENLLGRLGPRMQTVVLVTGGFHAEGITKSLTESGVAVVSLVPKINKIETAHGSAYLSVFTQEKTPLEKLFSGEKLFLSENTAQPLTTIVPPLVAATASMESPNLKLPEAEEMARIEAFLKRATGNDVSFQAEPFKWDEEGKTGRFTYKIGSEQVSVEVRVASHGNFEILSLNQQSLQTPSQEASKAMERAVRIHKKLIPLSKTLAKIVAVVTERKPLAEIARYESRGYMVWFLGFHRMVGFSEMLWLLAQGEANRWGGRTVASRSPRLSLLSIFTPPHLSFNFSSPIPAMGTDSQQRSLGTRVFHERYGIGTVGNLYESNLLVHFDIHREGVSKACKVDELKTGSEEELARYEKDRARLISKLRGEFQKFGPYLRHLVVIRTLQTFTAALRANEVPTEKDITSFHSTLPNAKERIEKHENILQGNSYEDLTKALMGLTYFQRILVRYGANLRPRAIADDNVTTEELNEFYRRNINKNTGRIFPEQTEHLKKFAAKQISTEGISLVGVEFDRNEVIQNEIPNDLKFIELFFVAVGLTSRDTYTAAETFTEPETQIEQVQTPVEKQNQLRQEAIGLVRAQWNGNALPVFWQLLSNANRKKFETLRPEWPTVLKEAGVPEELCITIPDKEYAVAKAERNNARVLLDHVRERLDLLRQSRGGQSQLFPVTLWVYDRPLFWAMHFDNLKQNEVLFPVQRSLTNLFDSPSSETDPLPESDRESLKKNGNWVLLTAHDPVTQFRLIFKMLVKDSRIDVKNIASTWIRGYLSNDHLAIPENGELSDAEILDLFRIYDPKKFVSSVWDDTTPDFHFGRVNQKSPVGLRVAQLLTETLFQVQRNELNRLLHGLAPLNLGGEIIQENIVIIEIINLIRSRNFISYTLEPLEERMAILRWQKVNSLFSHLRKKTPVLYSFATGRMEALQNILISDQQDGITNALSNFSHFFPQQQPHPASIGLRLAHFAAGRWSRDSTPSWKRSIGAWLNASPDRVTRIGLWSLPLEIAVLWVASFSLSTSLLLVGLVFFALIHGVLQFMEKTPSERGPPLASVIALSFRPSLILALAPYLFLDFSNWYALFAVGVWHLLMDYFSIKGIREGMSEIKSEMKGEIKERAILPLGVWLMGFVFRLRGLAGIKKMTLNGPAPLTAEDGHRWYVENPWFEILFIGFVAIAFGFIGIRHLFLTSAAVQIMGPLVGGAVVSGAYAALNYPGQKFCSRYGATTSGGTLLVMSVILFFAVGATLASFSSAFLLVGPPFWQGYAFLLVVWGSAILGRHLSAFFITKTSQRKNKSIWHLLTGLAFTLVIVTANLFGDHSIIRPSLLDRVELRDGKIYLPPNLEGIEKRDQLIAKLEQGNLSESLHPVTKAFLHKHLGLSEDEYSKIRLIKAPKEVRDALGLKTAAKMRLQGYEFHSDLLPLHDAVYGRNGSEVMVIPSEIPMNTLESQAIIVHELKHHVQFKGFFGRRHEGSLQGWDYLRDPWEIEAYTLQLRFLAEVGGLNKTVAIRLLIDSSLNDLSDRGFVKQIKHAQEENKPWVPVLASELWDKGKMDQHVSPIPQFIFPSELIRTNDLESSDGIAWKIAWQVHPQGNNPTALLVESPIGTTRFVVRFDDQQLWMDPAGTREEWVEKTQLILKEAQTFAPDEQQKRMLGHLHRKLGLPTIVHFQAQTVPQEPTSPIPEKDSAPGKTPIRGLEQTNPTRSNPVGDARVAVGIVVSNGVKNRLAPEALNVLFPPIQKGSVNDLSPMFQYLQSTADHLDNSDYRNLFLSTVQGKLKTTPLLVPVLLSFSGLTGDSPPSGTEQANLVVLEQVVTKNDLKVAQKLIELMDETERRGDPVVLRLVTADHSFAETLSKQFGNRSNVFVRAIDRLDAETIEQDYTYWREEQPLLVNGKNIHLVVGISKGIHFLKSENSSYYQQALQNAVTRIDPVNVFHMLKIALAISRNA